MKFNAKHSKHWEVFGRILDNVIFVLNHSCVRCRIKAFSLAFIRSNRRIAGYHQLAPIEL